MSAVEEAAARREREVVMVSAAEAAGSRELRRVVIGIWTERKIREMGNGQTSYSLQRINVEIGI
jgi:hypothetical protein